MNSSLLLLSPSLQSCRQSTLLLSSQELREIYLDFSCQPPLSGCLPKCSTGHSGRVVINSLTLNLVAGPPSQIRCSLWYNSGKSAVRVASHLLIGLEACSTRGVGIWYYKPSQRSWLGEGGHRPKQQNYCLYFVQYDIPVKLLSN